MEVEQFFTLFLEELKNRKDLWGYYKFWSDTKSFEFRKAYFTQRLQYIAQRVQDPTARIWDCGCGYGTTAIFLAMNGFKVYGTTLEFYFDALPARFAYWKEYGLVENFQVGYENLFDAPPAPASYDIIIVQDTLHHLEPLPAALKLLKQALAPGGKMIVVEMNGNNIVQNLIFFKLRGFKRVIEIYDEKLKKKILLGNENIRSYGLWKKEFAKAGLTTDDVEYIRYFYPNYYTNKRPTDVLKKEQEIWKNNSLLKEYFFFGLNFTASISSGR